MRQRIYSNIVILIFLLGTALSSALLSEELWPFSSFRMFGERYRMESRPYFLVEAIRSDGSTYDPLGLESSCGQSTHRFLYLRSLDRILYFEKNLPRAKQAIGQLMARCLKPEEGMRLIAMYPYSGQEKRVLWDSRGADK